MGSRVLHLLLIALVVFATGPRMVAGGEEGVICGAAGAAPVVYNFETAQPEKPAPLFECCDFCLACDLAAGPPVEAGSPTAHARPAEALLARAAFLEARAQAPARARGPPTLS